MMRTILFGLIAAAAVVGIAVAAQPPAPIGATCEVGDLVSQLRGLGHGSPAYAKYLKHLLREVAPTLSEAELRAAFEAERDPEMIELLATALAARTDRGGEPDALRAVAARALEGSDPRARAAATRALRGTSTLEHAPDLYKRLVHDPSPDVRREAAENLVVDNDSVYGGRHGPAADTAVAAALAADDPAVTARVLGGVSMSAISHESAAGLRRLLTSPTSEIRGATVVALGGVPGSEAAGSREALIALYRGELDASIRIAILESIARLGFAAAVPDLESLRDVDPSLSIEIDEWIRVLRLGLQEWSLLLREKRLYEQARK
jgi:HEAT repeat protein